MALNDAAVITAAQGYIFRAAVGTAAPTPAELAALDPEVFGAQKSVVKVSGTPTSYTLLIGDDATPTVALAASANAAAVQAAIETIVGAGNVKVTGVSAADAAGLTIYFAGALQGKSVDVAEGTYVGGTTPDTTITTTAPNGWKNLGHTSRDDMPEFGFDGGDTTVKGTWQKKRLREVATGDPLADSLTVHLEQWDRDSLELYYGADAANTAGVFGVSGDFTPIECAFIVIVIDGAAKIAFYAPKASVKRDDSINMPVDEFSSLPVKATFLDLPGHRLYDWISEDLFPLPA